MKKVNIAYALKANKRIVGRIAELRALISLENSIASEETRSIDIMEKNVEVEKLVKQLINNKTAIAIANTKIAKELFTLAEKKAEIVYLRGINTFSGSRRDPYNREEKIEYTAIFNKANVNARIESIQNEINELQDRIDEFNATELIDVE